MFDLKWIRDNPETFDAGMAKRGLAPVSSEIIELDRRRRDHVSKLQDAQTRRNDASKQIGAAKAGGDDAKAQALIDEVAEIKSFIQSGEDEERRLSDELDAVLSGLPNLPLDEVPVGEDEADNVEHRVVGAVPEFGFTPLQHFEIGEALGLMDFETAAKLSGARFVVLKGALARLERALAHFMLDLQTTEHGYLEVQPPFLVRDEALYGTSQLPKFAEDLFRTTDGKWLIPTAEVPLTNLVRESIMDEADLPKRFTAYTPCFRSEAGSAGKDTRGMIRQHQFTKVELVSITTPETSGDELERMLTCAEEVLKRLELPYRVVVLVDRRHGLRRAQDLRHRGLAARTGHVPGDFKLFGVRRLPGAADAGPLPSGGRQGHPLRSHVERLRACGRPHPGGGARKSPARGRLGGNTRGAQALHGRPRRHFGGGLT